MARFHTTAEGNIQFTAQEEAEWDLRELQEANRVYVPQSITALQGLLAIDAAGLSTAYEAWANDTARTFAEKAFINRAQTWKRDDATLVSSAAAFGLTETQVDEMFILGATL